MVNGGVYRKLFDDQNQIIIAAMTNGHDSHNSSEIVSDREARTPERTP